MFDLQRFEDETFYPRTKRVSVPALAPFFAEGTDPELVVRGLNSNELHSAMEAGQKSAAIESIVKAIADKKEQVKAIREAIGLSEGTPAEVRKRIEMLVHGGVEPKFTHSSAAKLAENYPIEFMHLTNVITELTGLGNTLEKPEAASQ